jgi:hypothetical protein
MSNNQTPPILSYLQPSASESHPIPLVPRGELAETTHRGGENFPRRWPVHANGIGWDSDWWSIAQDWRRFVLCHLRFRITNTSSIN